MAGGAAVRVDKFITKGVGVSLGRDVGQRQAEAAKHCCAEGAGGEGGGVVIRHGLEKVTSTWRARIEQRGAIFGIVNSGEAKVQPLSQAAWSEARWRVDCMRRRREGGRVTRKGNGWSGRARSEGRHASDRQGR